MASPDSNRPSEGLMPTRLGGILGLVAFAYTLLAGLLQADNAFATIVLRAIIAMVGTLVIGYLIGWVAQTMLNENLRVIEARKSSEEKSEESPKSSATDGR